MGHLIPFAELARRLVADHGLAATLLFAAARSPPSEQYLAVAASVPEGVDLVALPAPEAPDELLAPASVRDRVARAVASSVPLVRDIARSVAATVPLAALVVDMVGAPARVVAEELGAPFYMFFTSPWMLLSLFLHLPAIDATRASEHRDAAEPIRLPGCVPIHTHDLPGSMLVDRSSETYASFVAMAKGAGTTPDGILVNTFPELEPAVGNAADGVKLPPVHAVGPLLLTRPISNSMDQDHYCLNWLDQQPRGSVVYVSFGSGGTLTWQQTTQLALGLELSQHRFVWAIKRPDQETPSGAFFGTSRHGAAPEFLPDGFMERTAVVGLVLQQPWSPQAAILGHASVGCFVTHCGWNSMLEGVFHGVPMVAWPLYAEQKMNAAMMEAHAGAAIRANVRDGRLVSKEEVAAVIRRVMEGDEADRMRKRLGELRDKATHALSKDGSSTCTLAQLTRRWKSTADSKSMELDVNC
ncbi:hypothetical protein GUJ93_ZPchr0005g15044 [Zizania palustris]|uniref:Glycosyltransferase n=1 Tax=Zizania palustris TaxID=103762 RepID=A0A8J5SMH7_ZIZPA|nr:hypothetical protein GUJ93_ZPchr0005g15044 [Zizania palustris]